MHRRERCDILDQTIVQPVSHARPQAGSFTQRVKVLMPWDATENPSVLFIMGNERTLTNEALFTPWRAYGRRRDTVIVCGEHRGYGKSVAGDDQSAPAYVAIGEALADYHAIRLAYAGRFPGKWVVCGYSYGGGLAIAYGHAFPGDCAAVLSSSGVVDWEPMLPSYDLAARENLGQGLYTRLCRHVDRLSPAEPFGRAWRGRELIYAFVTGLAQRGTMNRRFLGLVDTFSRLPTATFIGVLRAFDALFAGGEAGGYVECNSRTRLSSAESENGRWSWRLWRWQQAMETGTFWVPSGQPTIYRRTAEDWRRECRMLFGVDAEVFTAAPWKVRVMVAELAVPLVYVRGGRDPWRRVGLEPDHPLANGRIMTFEDGFHCPDRDPRTGHQVIQAVLGFIRNGENA